MLCYRCGRVVEFFDNACARTCDRVRVCVCEIIRFLTLSAPMDFTNIDEEFFTLYRLAKSNAYPPLNFH